MVAGMTSDANRFGRAVRVVHVVYSTYPFDPRVRRVVEAQRDWGFDVDVVALEELGQARKESLGGVVVQRVPLRAVRGGRARYAFQYAIFLMAAAFLVLRIRVHNHVDVVHVHSLPDFLVVSAATAKLLGSRVVLDLHEAMPEIVQARFRSSARSLLATLARAAEWMSCAFADAVLTPSDSIRGLLVGRGTPASKVTVIMNSPRSIQTRQIDQEVLRTSLGLDGHFAIVYVGGLNEERDLGILIRAVAGVRTDPPLRVIMFGYGSTEYRTYLQVLAEEEGLSDFFLGPRLLPEEVQSYLSLSDIGVVTYQRNPLTELAIPNKVFEYSAAGKPLILARLSTLQSLFGDAALYYEPGNPGDLREKIIFLLEHPNEARRLAEQGSAVLAECRWDIMEERLRGVYAGLVSSGGG